jgi:predicted ester cyclase
VSTEGEQETSAEQRKALIRRFYDEAWNRGEYAVVDELFALELARSLDAPPAGAEREKQHIATIRAVFADLQIVVQDVVVDTEAVAARWTMTGTDTGGFMGRPPTGREVEIWGVDFFHFEGQRVVGTWAGVDMLGLMVELEILPSPWRTGGAATEGS